MKREVNKPAAIITAIVLGILVCVFSVFGIRMRNEAEQRSMEYCHVFGIVIDYKYAGSEGDDGNETYIYSVTIQYEAGEEIITVVDEIRESEPEIGDNVDIMYNLENVKEYYIAKKDVISGKFFPTDYNGDGLLFTAALLFCFVLFLLALFIPSDKVAAIVVGLSLLLISVFGFAFAFILENLGLILTFPFGLFGIVILYVTIFPPKGKAKREMEAAANFRLFIVRDIIYDSSQGNSPIVLLAMKENANEETYFSYTDNYLRFRMGEKCQLDTGFIMNESPVRLVQGIMTTDISYIPVDEFKPLSPVVEKLFATIN